MNIYQTLEEECEKRGATILFASEAGSRAWGFESKDSDYDIRFVYAYSDRNKYISLIEPKDVIQFNIGDYEFAGWDLRKALFLAKKSNFSLYEWLGSPIQYHSTEWNDLFEGYINNHYSEKRAAHHYLSMAGTIYTRYIAQSHKRTAKKYLYILRSLLCIEYMYRTRNLPPVRFEDVYSIAGPCKLVKAIEEIVEIKKKGLEDDGIPPELNAYVHTWIIEALDKYNHQWIEENLSDSKPNEGRLDDIYRHWVK